jgi:hypothetical protein
MVALFKLLVLGVCKLPAMDFLFLKVLVPNSAFY